MALAGCANLSTAGQPPPAALLRVTVTRPANGGVYVEGAVRYLRITGPALDTRLRLNDGSPTAISLPGGESYELESWARPCDANCQHFDGATDRCSGTVAMPDSGTTAIEITAPPGEGCTFAVIPTDGAQ
jgi:hypothetical protein